MMGIIKALKCWQNLYQVVVCPCPDDPGLTLTIFMTGSIFGRARRGFNCSVAPAFQSWFAVEYSSCFISVMNLDLYVRCFDSLMSRGPSRGPNNLYVYMNHNRT